jgi:hypothetical protein
VYVLSSYKQWRSRCLVLFTRERQNLASSHLPVDGAQVKHQTFESLQLINYSKDQMIYLIGIDNQVCINAAGTLSCTIDSLTTKSFIPGVCGLFMINHDIL